MATFTTQTVTATGLTPTFVAASAGGDSYTPGSTTALYFKNGSGGSITVTVVTTASSFGQPISNVGVVVGPSSEVICGPFDPAMVMQPNSSLANLTYSGVTNLTVAVISTPPS